MTENHEEQAWELTDRLKELSIVNDAWLSDVRVGNSEVGVLFNQREIPMNTLKMLGEFGDLRIEGTDGSMIEAIVYV